MPGSKGMPLGIPHLLPPSPKPPAHRARAAFSLRSPAASLFFCPQFHLCQNPNLWHCPAWWLPSQRGALPWPPPRLTQPLSTPRAHPEDSGAVVAKRLKQEVGAGAGVACAGVHTCERGCDATTCLGPLCQLGVTAVGVLGWVAQGTCSPVRSRQAGEQSRPELLALPVGLEPPGAAYRASLEEDTGSLSGESLDGHLQGEWGSLLFPGGWWWSTPGPSR